MRFRVAVVVARVWAMATLSMDFDLERLIAITSVSWFSDIFITILELWSVVFLPHE